MPYGVIINCIAVFIGGLLGAVLKDLGITAPQGLPTMLSIPCKP